MKKFISAILGAAAFIAIIAPSPPAEAQVAWCGLCCDRDVYGNARPRCVLVNPWPCGGGCVCAGVYGAGFACN